MRIIRNVIGGEFVDGQRCYDKIDPVDGTVAAQVHEADAGVVDRAVAAARRALDAWSAHDRRVTHGVVAAGGRPDRGALRRVRRGRGVRHGQAGGAGPGAGCRAGGREFPLVRRHGGFGWAAVVPDGSARRPSGVELRGAQTPRCRRGNRAVEPSVAAAHLEGGAGPGLWQHRGGQAVGGDAVHRDVARRGAVRRRVFPTASTTWCTGSAPRVRCSCRIPAWTA